MRHNHAKHLLMHMALAHHKRKPVPSLRDKLSHEEVIHSLKHGLVREKQIIELTKETNELKMLLKECGDELTDSQHKNFLNRLAHISAEIKNLEK